MKVSAPHRGWTSGRATPSLRPTPLCGRDSKPGRTPLIVRGNLSRQPEPALPRGRGTRGRVFVCGLRQGSRGFDDDGAFDGRAILCWGFWTLEQNKNFHLVCKSGNV